MDLSNDLCIDHHIYRLSRPFTIIFLMIFLMTYVLIIVFTNCQVVSLHLSSVNHSLLQITCLRPFSSDLSYSDNCPLIGSEEFMVTSGRKLTKDATSNAIRYSSAYWFWLKTMQQNWSFITLKNNCIKLVIICK